jgi:hypothetical protein
MDLRARTRSATRTFAPTTIRPRVLSRGHGAVRRYVDSSVRRFVGSSVRWFVGSVVRWFGGWGEGGREKTRRRERKILRLRASQRLRVLEARICFSDAFSLFFCRFARSLAA